MKCRRRSLQLDFDPMTGLDVAERPIEISSFRAMGHVKQTRPRKPLTSLVMPVGRCHFGSGVVLGCPMFGRRTPLGTESGALERRDQPPGTGAPLGETGACVDIEACGETLDAVTSCGGDKKIGRSLGRGHCCNRWPIGLRRGGHGANGVKLGHWRQKVGDGGCHVKPTSPPRWILPIHRTARMAASSQGLMDQHDTS